MLPWTHVALDRMLPWTGASPRPMGEAEFAATTRSASAADTNHTPVSSASRHTCAPVMDGPSIRKAAASSAHTL